MVRIRLLKALQLAASVGVLVLIWLIYPGAVAAFASVGALCYVIAAVGATRDYRIAILVAFAFSVLTAVLSSSGIYLFLKNDFDFLAGTFGTRSGFYLPPYLFLLVAAASGAAVVLHGLSWPWMMRPREVRARAARR